MKKINTITALMSAMAVDYPTAENETGPQEKYVKVKNGKKVYWIHHSRFTKNKTKGGFPNYYPNRGNRRVERFNNRSQR